MNETQAEQSQMEEKELCFYCKQNPAVNDTAYLVQLSRVTKENPETGNGDPVGTFEKKEIAIPRCKSCALVHQRLHKIRRLSLFLIFGLGIGGGLLMNLFLFGMQVTHPGGVLFAFIIISGSLAYFVLAQRFGNPNQVPGEKTAIHHPTCQQLKDEGWST